MRNASILALVLFLAALAASAKQGSVDELKARAEAARPSDQVKLFIELAELQFKAASDSYDKGDGEAGRAAIQDAVSSCERAGAAAQATGKDLKRAEIHVRDLQRKVQALQRSLSYEEREPLKEAVDRLEKVRSDLLATMFRKKS